MEGWIHTRTHTRKAHTHAQSQPGMCIYIRICVRIFDLRKCPATGISLAEKNLQAPSNWNFTCWEFPLLKVLLTESPLLLRVPLTDSSSYWEFPLTESSTSLRVPLLRLPATWTSLASTPCNLNFTCFDSRQLEFHLLWVPLTAQQFEFALLRAGNSLVNPPVKVSQNSDPLTELSSTTCI